MYCVMGSYRFLKLYLTEEMRVSERDDAYTKKKKNLDILWWFSQSKYYKR